MLVLGQTQNIAAGNFYVYKDQNGSTLLTNRARHDRNLTKVKVTYYPESNIHSYRNWGSTEASVAPSFSKNKNAFDHIIQRAAQQHGVSAGLIKAVMHTESGFNIYARSPVGAQGLMQLMPATAKRFNVSNVHDPEQSIFAGAKYLAWLTKRFNGNTILAIAGYNAGEGNVTKYGGIPPFRETQDYVKRVTSRYQNLYANGLGNISSALTQSVNLPSAPTSNSNNLLSNATPTKDDRDNIRYANRIIISDGQSSFTDAPMNSYATANATASARIHIEN